MLTFQGLLLSLDLTSAVGGADLFCIIDEAAPLVPPTTERIDDQSCFKGGAREVCENKCIRKHIPFQPSTWVVPIYE
uniref:Secreted protein n=1 Tax=Heterorhabditis bacteriophora TaxID=37862 RepID=A0A1I7XAK6_HETBA